MVALAWLIVLSGCTGFFFDFFENFGSFSGFESFLVRLAYFIGIPFRTMDKGKLSIVFTEIPSLYFFSLSIVFPL
jgi:hypothetical protein